MHWRSYIAEYVFEQAHSSDIYLENMLLYKRINKLSWKILHIFIFYFFPIKYSRPERLKESTDAYHFAISSKSILEELCKRGRFIDYSMPVGKAENVIAREIQRSKKKWTTIDQFKDLQFGL
jgi:hypothetical protein